MGGRYDMEGIKTELIIEYQRLDLEYEVIRGIQERLAEQGNFSEAEKLAQAKQHVFQAICLIKNAWKCLPDFPYCEQLKMDFFDM